VFTVIPQRNQPFLAIGLRGRSAGSAKSGGELQGILALWPEGEVGGIRGKRRKAAGNLRSISAIWAEVLVGGIRKKRRRVARSTTRSTKVNQGQPAILAIGLRGRSGESAESGGKLRSFLALWGDLSAQINLICQIDPTILALWAEGTSTEDPRG